MPNRERDQRPSDLHRVEISQGNPGHSGFRIRVSVGTAIRGKNDEELNVFSIQAASPTIESVTTDRPDQTKWTRSESDQLSVLW
jgi:hypothetical protein